MRQAPWRDDPIILKRMARVEAHYLDGRSMTAIANEIGVSFNTIHKDVQRLKELWLEQTKAEQEEKRTTSERRLRRVQELAIEAYHADASYERAVLFDEAVVIDGEERKAVGRGENGIVTFRSSKVAALAQARQAEMDIAKLNGLIVEKNEHEIGPHTRRFIGVDVEDV